MQSNDTPIPSSQYNQKFTRLSPRWAIILVPVILITMAISTRFIVHPTLFDAFSPTSSHQYISWYKSLSDWSLHERHKDPDNLLRPQASQSLHFIKRSTPSPTSAPTVPTNPTLPTPFPQPYDTTLSYNFSTTSCYNFFLNMTQTNALRSCRPFSLLLTHSQEFIQQTQDDINAINTDIWGTCNTDISQAQCEVNTAWFASTLRYSCSSDLSEQNLLALDTLTGLRAFNLMRDTACSVDPDQNTYCYVQAVASSDPSSYYFYQLPLGQPLPKITNGACNFCTKSLMSTYSAALASANATDLTGLQSTYQDAAISLNDMCGSSYAQAKAVASSSTLQSIRLTKVGEAWTVLFTVALVWSSMSSLL